MKIRSLKTQVLIWFGTITTLIIIAFNIALYYFLEQNIKLSIQNELYHKAVFINNHILINTPIEQLLKDKQLETYDITIVKEDKIVYTKGQTDFSQLIPYIKTERSFFVFEQGKTLNGLYIFRLYTPFRGAILFNKLNIDSQINANLKNMKNILIVLEPILLILLIFTASKLIDKILKPITNITKTANNISVTDLSQKIEQPLKDDEIKDLVNSFNNMIERLQGGVEHLEQFNSDVSHELKTPLTVIKGEIEITLNKIRKPEYYIKSLKTINYEANQIQEIVDNLLMLTKYTKENIKQTFQETTLDSLLLDTIDQYKTQLKTKNIKLHLEKFESISINANSQLITTIFSNLLDNAIKYTLENKNIYLSLYKDKKIYFSIKDEGIGIANEHLSKVIDRFYRIDESRNKKIKGFGLGLSIVRNSLDLHGGTIEIKSDIDIGTTIVVSL